MVFELSRRRAEDWAREPPMLATVRINRILRIVIVIESTSGELESRGPLGSMREFSTDVTVFECVRRG